MWQPIETAPRDQFLLLCGLSGYTTTPMVVTTGCMCSDYHVGRWIDHANDDLTDWGFTPTHWAPLILPGAQPVESIKDVIIAGLQSQFDTEGITEHDSGDALIRLSDAIAAVEDNFAQPAPIAQDESVRKAWARFCNELYRSPDAPYPGMADAFERHFSQSFTDREWRTESATWAAAWKAAKRHEAQARPAPSIPEGWKLVPIEPTVKIRKAMHYAYWKSPQLPYHDGSPELWNAAYAAMLAAATEAKP